LIGAPLLNTIFGLPFAQLTSQYLRSSPFASLPNKRRLTEFIVKSGDDILKEVLIMSLITYIQQNVFGNLPDGGPRLKPYNIVCLGDECGVIEVLEDVQSVDEVKRCYAESQNASGGGSTSLVDYWRDAYPTTAAREAATDKFLRSLVAYSLICYVFQIKDRHNGNILLSRDGSLTHIDYGYILGAVPKASWVPVFNEKAPFKLTKEFWEVIGGWEDQPQPQPQGSGAEGGARARKNNGVKFCEMFEQGLDALREHGEEICLLVRAQMGEGAGDTYRRGHGESVEKGIRRRLMLDGAGFLDKDGALDRRKKKEFVFNLIGCALNDWSTSTYDWMNCYINGYVV
jgi:phosphatidylinositol 4-kinase